MKKLLYILTSFIITTNLFSQESITQENIQQAVDAWLEDSVSTEAIYGHISDWDVSSITNMSDLFRQAYFFNVDLSSWDVSSVTNMNNMFNDASSFNGDLSSWDVSNVTDMSSMFAGASSLSEVNQCAIQTSFSTNSNWPYEWECTSVQIGDFAFGGIVFYVDETGENGLVCAPSNLNGVVEGWNDFQWMDITVSGNQFIQLNASTSNLVGTGASNSSIIINSQGIGADATSMCSLLDLNGYDDWFLPSLNELWEINLNNELISNIALENGGDQFDFGFYWSSSEVNLTDAWAINFVNLDNAPQGSFELSRGKMNGYLVRPIRTFGTTQGCTDATAFNYNIEANTDDGSCEQYPIGCTNPLAINFDSLAIAENFTCVFDNQDFLTGSSWEIDFWVQQQDIISDYVDGYFNFIDENQLMVITTDDLGNFQYINALYQVIDNSIYIYPSDNEIEPDYDTNYYQGHYGVFGEDSILWNPDMNWTCSGCNGQEILDADSIMGMSLQDIASLGQGLCFFNSSAFMSFESQEDCFSFIEETVWINLDFFTGEVAVLDFNLTNNQLSLTNDDDIFNLTFTDTYVGCLDPDAVNFDEQSNQQLFDEFGNLSCIYDSCDNTPFEGCIYPDGFGPFNEYFGQVECISYGGNPCGNILGCTDPSALNYAASATEDDGSCITSIDGCTDSSAFNYNGNANSDDESCVFDCSEVEIFESFDNYNAGDYLANQSNGLWTTWSNSPGTEEDAYVTDSLSFNGSNSLVLQGGGTTDIVLPLGDYQNGIWNLSFMMYVPEGFGGYFNLLHDFDSTNGNNNWAEEIYFSQSGQGFTDITGQQFDFEHDKWFEVIFNIDIEDNIILCSIDGDNLSWEWSISSSNTDISIGAINFFANAPDGEIALYYIDELRLTNNSCSELGCTDLEADNYDPFANLNDESCEYLGCTDSTAFNYNPLANTEDASCLPFILGCTNPDYFEFDPQANLNDGSCLNIIIEGCTDNTAFNFSSNANVDDGTCVDVIEGCINSEFLEFNPQANTDDESCMILVVEGCFDSEAFNYNEQANTDDNSCIYDLLISNSINLGSSSYQFEISVYSFENYSVLWDFGDGFYSNEENPFHVYALNGTYNVTVSISNGLMALVDNFVLVIDIPGLEVEEIINPIQKEVYHDLLGRLVIFPQHNSIYIRTRYFENGLKIQDKVIK